MSQRSEHKDKQNKGQFWTPDWIADALVAYVLPKPNTPVEIFDPAVGEGSLLEAASRRAPGIDLLGCEIDPVPVRTLMEAHVTRGHGGSRLEVKTQDFFDSPMRARFPAIVANPPYIRHHRISATQKAALAEAAQQITGQHIDGRAGLHVHFLIWCLNQLAPEGRLAFIVPADICEGVFSRSLWNWIGSTFRIDGVIAFDSEASPFPDLDTNPIILLIANATPGVDTVWAQCDDRICRPPSNHPTSPLATWVSSGMSLANPPEGVRAISRSVTEMLSTGASRPPREHVAGRRLGEFIAVQRGVATGANDFFLFTKERLTRFKIPVEFTVRTVGRTRDVSGDHLTDIDLAKLDRAGRPTYLLSLPGLSRECLPRSIVSYLEWGEQMGLPERPFLAARSVWYKSETREPSPPYLFSYLGRRSARFIRNHAGVTPLSSFLCVYPNPKSELAPSDLDALLQDPELTADLAYVGKSYGSGAIKVEPRALESLPVPPVCLDRLQRYRSVA